MNETKKIGLLTELQCQAYFTNLGYNVLIPLGEDCRYDMIVDFNGILERIQVKTCHVTKNNTGIEFATRSTRTNSKENINKSYSKEEIDYFATYYNNKCYLVKVEECSTSKILSFENKRVNQFTPNFIEDYEAEKQIQKILNGEDEISLEERKIYQYDLRNNLIATYDSCREAAKQLGDVNKNAHISQAIRGIRKTAYGYKWTDTLIKS
jgi:hypothetical protein